MALGGGDGFDGYSQASDALLRVGPIQWSFPGSVKPVLTTPGRGGYGKCLSLLPNNGNGGDGVVATFSENAATLIFGFGLGHIEGGVDSTSFNVALIDPTTNTTQCSLVFSLTSGIVSAYRGSTTGTLLGQSANNSFNLDAFPFVEVKATIDSSAGAIAVEVGGQPVLTLTGVNTQNGSNSQFGQVQLSITANTSTDSFLIDDFRWNDTTTGPGSYPANSWLGDLRIASIGPISDAADGWTQGVTPTLTFWTGYNSGSNQALATGTIFYQRVQATGGVLTDVVLQLSSALTGTIIAAVYADAVLPSGITPLPPEPGSLLCTSATVTNPAAGMVNLAVSSGPTLADGTFYWIALQVSAATHIDVNAVENPTGAYTQTQAYGSFPSTASGITATTAAFWLGLTVTAANNYQQVGEWSFDSDNSFNYATSLGVEDLFNLQSLIGTISYIIGVQIVGAYRQTDASAHTITQQVKTGGTDHAQPAKTLSTTYQFFVDVLPVNPTTGASWTVAEINALQAGYTAAS